MTSLDARSATIDSIKAYGEAERDHDFPRALAMVAVVARNIAAYEAAIWQEEQASAKAR